ncbi:hypothetical protein [Limisalsivibrio acetivorans]|uniref:hypothetical protein n=1 Tax=Limisalsivibrio acetivorans TaxID=1304888 RepID=UPI0003B773DE|nr:hypothetical protein [Limisalsivibrio acetivorans]
MIWNNLKYFSKDENWGDPDRINPALLILLDSLRGCVDRPFLIHCGYETSGHATSSRHYTGDAVDFHIEGVGYKTGVNALLEALHKVQICDTVSAAYVGLGIYPDWRDPGFHLDIRGYSARWGRIGSSYTGFESAYKSIGGDDD